MTSPRPSEDNLQLLHRDGEFADRHIGPTENDIAEMVQAMGLSSLDELVDAAVPAAIRSAGALDLPDGLTEDALIALATTLAATNVVKRNHIGCGYYDCITPPVIARNVLEGPGWYTQYTPYQAEISQGRLEALLIFQNMVADLTGLPIANASMLDEATAAAEAMTMSAAVSKKRTASRFFVSPRCHPQTIAVVHTRAEPQGIDVVVSDEMVFDDDVFGCLVQYPDTDGFVADYRELIVAAHDAGVIVTMATDLLALTLLESPGTLGADIAVGSAQRFGVPLGFGGPHAAFFATTEANRRRVPGRLVGVSKDAHGRPALRLALQTREQHIRRERATSNICTSQVLLAIMAAFYACYHGPEGLARIARRVRLLTETLAAALESKGYEVVAGPRFDTVKLRLPPATVIGRAEAAGLNLRRFDDGVGISLDETTTLAHVGEIVAAVTGHAAPNLESFARGVTVDYAEPFARTTPYLEHEHFTRYHSETEMLRFIHRLQARDLSLTGSMIPLGSCTMKLNATAEMIPITLPGFANIHPFAPVEQTAGYLALIDELGQMLCEITGFSAISFQPNAGSQGEYAGLLVIRAYHQARGDDGRTICLIPQSAHGTNPASAVMAGMKVVVVRCDDNGNIDVAHLRELAEQHSAELAALMVTYPSTHGVFEEAIGEICDVIHEHGGQVYMDGANLNAMVGLCKPGEIGADVAHLNLHKTFSIPHGGGGPGMGPIVVAQHLAPHLPSHPLVTTGGSEPVGAVAAGPYGSPSILPISWAYIRLLGAQGVTRASRVAILGANYIASQLRDHYDVLYTGPGGLVAHECILDLRGFKQSAGVTVEDVAKRLMDYGFHAPTMSWPVAGTFMVEPTESESLRELNRFVDAMIAIRGEIADIEEGRLDREDNPLKNAPHTARDVLAGQWPHSYSRELAAWPIGWLRDHKFWPPVSRVDNAWGDRHLVCSCPPLSAYEE